MGAIFCFFAAILVIVHEIPIRIILVFDEQKDSANSVLFPIQVPIRTSSNCLSHNNPANGCPCMFRSRGTTGSSMFAHDFGHLFRVRRIHTSGHSDLGILSNTGASSILT